MPAYAPSRIYRNISLGTTGQVIKAAPGVIVGWFLSNSGAAAAYVKLYDKATAPTEADTPALTIYLPAGAAANVGPGDGAIGPFAAGISARATTGAADNNTGAPAANEVIVNIFYS